MFLETVDQFATVATAKAAFLRRSPLGFWISSMMAGGYVGLGIILIFCVGANVDPSIRPIVMGASFGIALTLVIFAGSDLFTGHTMFMTLGWLRGRTSLRRSEEHTSELQSRRDLVCRLLLEKKKKKKKRVITKKKKKKQKKKKKKIKKK